MYEVRAYYGINFSGLEEVLTTDNFSSAVDFSHEKLIQGFSVKIFNLTTGIYKSIPSDWYIDNWEENNGQFPYNYTDFEMED